MSRPYINGNKLELICPYPMSKYQFKNHITQFEGISKAIYSHNIGMDFIIS